jgi:hypothetical protein
VTDSLDLGLFALEETAAKHDQLIRQLAEIAQGLARVMPEGVTISDVRKEARRQCLTLPEKSHFLGAVMKRAGLIGTDETRRSDIDESHGNLQRVWRRP